MAEPTKEIEFYITSDGKIPFNEWYESLKDKRAKLEVSRRLDRAAASNFGDHKGLVEHLYEMRITYGPGYRIYYTEKDGKIIVLFCGGDKKTQSQDIAKAKQYLIDYLGEESL
ncbi:MAG: type II toxin-antitoxin system RelE/ParE family toxin [Blastocatellia bacterium]